MGDTTPEERMRQAQQKARRRYDQLRRDACGVSRAMTEWDTVDDEDAWLRVCETSQDEHRSGRFLIERLGAERYLDPKLMPRCGRRAR